MNDDSDIGENSVNRPGKGPMKTGETSRRRQSDHNEDEEGEDDGYYRIRPGDPLFLQNNDQSNQILVTELLNEVNYLTWSNSMISALETRDKLGFITGEVAKPDMNHASFKQWRRVNAMIVAWIKNSLCKEIARGFLFATDARTLWEELKDRFGESNTALIHELKRDINNMRQGADSVAMYYTKLKGLWDHFACVKPRRRCVCCNCCRCGYNESVTSDEEEDKVHQFLMGLNEEYKAITDQIIMMDPLPNIARVCSIVEKVEKQRVVKNDYQSLGQMSAMASQRLSAEEAHEDGVQNTAMMTRGYQRNAQNERQRTVRNPDQKCEYCGKIGHLRDTCFKLKGFPDWFYEKKGEKPPAKTKFPYSANAVASSSNSSNEEQMMNNNNGASSSGGEMQGMITSLIQQELSKFLKGKAPMQEQGAPTDYVNLAHLTDFSGP